MITYSQHSLIWVLMVLSISTGQAQLMTKHQPAISNPWEWVTQARTPVEKINAWLDVSSGYIDRSQTDSAQYALNQGFLLINKAHYAVGEYFLLSYQTELLDKSTLFDEAFRYGLKAFRKAESIGDGELVGDSYTLLGLLYNDSGRPQQAIRCLLKSLDLLPRHSHQTHSVSQRYHALLNLGQCYLKLNRDAPAIAYLNQARQEAAEQQDFRIMAIACRLAADAYGYIGQHELAKEQYEAGLKYALSIQDWDAAILFYPHLFLVYYRENQRSKAMNTLNEGLRLVEQTPNRIATLPRKNFYAELVPIYRLLGNYPKVLQMQQTVLDITEQINRQNSSRQLLLLQEFNRQEKDMLQLTSERKTHQLLIQQNRMQNAALCGLMVLLAVVFSISLYSLRQRRKLEHAQQQKQLAELEQQREVASLKAMLAGEEQERSRLAHELHNGIGGVLIATRHSVERQHLLNPIAGWEESLALVDDAYQEVRRIAHNLMPQTLQRAGLAAALEQYCSMVDRSTQLQLTFQSYSLPLCVETPLELWLYRIVQELVSNVLKHAGATTALVQLCCTNDLIHLTVEDDGRGFLLAAALRQNGMGLHQLIERVGCMHGKVQIDSTPGLGTSILVELPITLPVCSTTAFSERVTQVLQTA